MQRAPLAGVGMSYSPINVPSGAMRPILLAKFSVHQRSPSGPTVTPRNEAFGVGTLKSCECAVAVEAAERVGAGLDEPDAAVGMRDHGARLAVVASGISNSVTAPSTVMRPTRLPAASLNHSAPSRTTIDSGLLPGVMPLLNSVIFAVRRDAADLAHFCLREPDIAIRAERDAVRPGFRGRHREIRSNTPAWRDAADLVGAFFCANHRLPSAPSAMPIGVAPAVGSENSVNAALRGSKQPIFAAPLSQNHKLRSGPSTQM